MNSRFIQRASSGFTLLELLLSLSLSTLVLVLLSNGMNQVVKRWSTEESQLEDKIDHSLVLLQIEQSIHASFPHQIESKQHKPTTYFSGTHNELRWVSTLSPGREPQLSAWRLFTLPSSEPHRRPYSLHLSTIPALTGPLDQRLAENSKKSPPLIYFPTIQIEYLIPSERISPTRNKPIEPQWKPAFSADATTAKLPFAVRISLTGIHRSAPLLTTQLIIPIGITS